MVLGLVSDPELRRSLLRAASPEEDVIFGAAEVQAALRYGFPRLLVYDGSAGLPLPRQLVGLEPTTLVVAPGLLAEWETDWRRTRVPKGRGDFAGERLAALLGERPRHGWVELVLRDLSLAAGAQLPPALRGFGRRVMEYPGLYRDLHAFRRTTGLSRGALKARFRRKQLRSPSAYLRWFRVLAAAHVLRDANVTTLQASLRLGFTSDGNFCRAIHTTAAMTPTELRSEQGRRRLVVQFVSRYLGPADLEAWSALAPLFLRSRVA